MSSSMKITVLLSFLALFYATANPIQTRDLPAGIDGDASGFLQSLKGIGDSLNQQQKDQLKAIATNPASTKQQVVDGLQNFFNSIGGDAQTKYNAFMDKLQTEAKKIEEAVKAEEASMSAEEKAFVEKANAINANMDITYAENSKQIKDLIDSASPEMKAKIQGDIAKLINEAAKQNNKINNL